MDKYCCNCKHEGSENDIDSPCGGCFEDNNFNAENWEAITPKERELRVQKIMQEYKHIVDSVEIASKSIGITIEDGTRFIDVFMENVNKK